MINKTLVSAIGFIFVIMLISGCEEQSLSETNLSPKKLRLIAVENMRLKKQLQKRDIEIEKHKAKTAKQKELLGKCREHKKVLELRSQEEMQASFMEVFKKAGEETSKLLLEENKKFKAQAQALEARIKQLEKELQQLKPSQPQPLSPTP